MAYNTVKVKKYSDVIEEYVAAATIYPGMVVELTSAGKVQAHSSAGGAVAPLMVALEDELQGKGIDDAYATDTPVQVWIPYRGDEFYGVLIDGESVVVGDALESAGNGYLKKHASGEIVGIALEALDLSGSSGEEESGALGYNKRLLVKAV